MGLRKSFVGHEQLERPFAVPWALFCEKSTIRPAHEQPDSEGRLPIRWPSLQVHYDAVGRSLDPSDTC